MGCNVVIRARNSLYGYLLHLCVTIKKSRSIEAGLCIIISFLFSLLTYACKLPLHFIAKVKEIKVKEEV